MGNECNGFVVGSSALGLSPSVVGREPGTRHIDPAFSLTSVVSLWLTPLPYQRTCIPSQPSCDTERLRLALNICNLLAMVPVGAGPNTVWMTYPNGELTGASGRTTLGLTKRRSWQRFP